MNVHFVIASHMKKKRSLIYSMTLIFLLVFPTLLFSRPLKIQVELSEPWGFFEPIGQKSDNKFKLTGIWIEIIDLLEKKTGFKIQTSLAPHARVTQNLENGKVDMSFLVKAESANPKIKSVAYMFSVSTIVLSLKEKKINTYNDLSTARIGVVRGSKNDPIFDVDGALFKQAYRNHKIIVNMLFQKRLDVVVGDSASIPYLIKKLNLDPTPYHTFTLRKAPVWMQLSIVANHLEHTDMLVRANNELKDSGAYGQILTKYMINHHR